jgi:lysophospholipid acyltransferase (LPLAT)-like uncharacterized protein
MSRQSGGKNEDFPFSTRLAELASGAALRVLAATWRYRIVGHDAVKSARAGQTPLLFSLWHGQLLPLIWLHRNEGVAILVSEHRDGEIIARVATSLGYRLIRGSTTRGGERALLTLATQLKAGVDAAVTPDGPKGPARSYAPGALIAAQRSGALVVPVAAHANRAWHLSSWDSFMIPKPFATVSVAYGRPTPVHSSSSREAALEAPIFQAMMIETEQLACA